MASNLDLDGNLVNEAMKLSGAKSKKDAVNSALEEYIKMLKRQQLMGLRGKLHFDPRYDYKKARAR